MFPKGQIFALDGQICPGLQEKRMARGCLGIGQPASIPMAWGAVRTHPHAFRPIREHQGHNGAARRPQSFIPAIVCIIPTNAAARCPGTQPGHHGRRTSMAADFHAFSRIRLTCIYIIACNPVFVKRRCARMTPGGCRGIGGHTECATVRKKPPTECGKMRKKAG